MQCCGIKAPTRQEQELNREDAEIPALPSKGWSSPEACEWSWALSANHGSSPMALTVHLWTSESYIQVGFGGGNSFLPFVLGIALWLEVAWGLGRPMLCLKSPAISIWIFCLLSFWLLTSILANTTASRNVGRISNVERLHKAGPCSVISGEPSPPAACVNLLFTLAESEI